MDILDLLPLLIPIVIGEAALLIYALFDILTHTNYKRGNRTIWLLITIIGMNYIGPIIYLIFGKRDE